MKTGSRKPAAAGKGAEARSEVRLTVRQARLLVACADLVDQKWGLTPMERLLVGAARRRVEKAKKGNH